MNVCRTREELFRALAALPRPVGFVPTLGALTRGHDSLVDRARADCRSVVGSIFVNPTQFGEGEDFTRYPRDEPADLTRFAAHGVDVAFVPHLEAVYPPGHATSVDVGPIGERLEGSARPGHFRGVATVVTILFELVRPDRSYFGQKDGQQVLVVRQLIRDLALGVELVVCPTVREPDGLAVSSRNRYLNEAERAAATVLWRALSAAAAAHGAGERDASVLRGVMAAEVAAEPLADLDYASLADGGTLDELERVDRPALASIAVRFPSARLIDCLSLDP